MQPREHWKLDTRALGREVWVFEQIPSTSTLAGSLAHEPRYDGLAILADEQTAGRGRLCRSWQCPPCAGVLLTVLLFPPAALCRATVMTAWAAVAVCETVRRLTNLQARIKWPNDVLIQGRKVCGILLERRGTATVCGIGLNLTQPAEYFLEAGLPQAASLGMFTPATPSRDETARALLRQLDEDYVRLVQGDLGTLEACWKWRVGLLGKSVVVATTDGVYHGRLRDMTWEGIELRCGDGQVVHLRPEFIQQLSLE